MLFIIIIQSSVFCWNWSFNYKSQDICGSKPYCDETITDFQSDPSNCGVCGNTCGSESECRNSTCIKLDNCPLNTNFTSDSKNCGACMNECQDGMKCYDGECTASIPETLRRVVATSPSYDQKNSCLDAHNKARNSRGIDSLIWDESLSVKATAFASTIQGNLRHSHTPNEGENLYAGMGGCVSAVNSWLSESVNYHNEPIGQGNFEKYGHYTQVLWTNTKKVGCGQVSNTVVCRYFPPGNIQGYRLGQ